MTKNSSALRSVTQPCAPTVWLSAPSLWVNTCLKGIAPFSLLCSVCGPLSPDHFALMTFADVLRPPRECFSLRLLPPMFAAMLTRIALRLACRNRRIQIRAHAKPSLSKCLGRKLAWTFKFKLISAIIEGCEIELMQTPMHTHTYNICI